MRDKTTFMILMCTIGKANQRFLFYLPNKPQIAITFIIPLACSPPPLRSENTCL